MEPNQMHPLQRNLDHTPRRKEANRKVEDGLTLYNPDITENGELEKTVRIFLNKPEEGVENLKQVYKKHT